MEAIKSEHIKMLNWAFDLQYFAGEKTEQPTPKRRQEARTKGQVPHSREVNSAVILLTAFLALRFLGPSMIKKITELFYYLYSDLAHPNIESDLMQLSIHIIYSFLGIILPLLLTVAVTGLLISFLQTGPVFSFEQIRPKFNKINFIEGFKRIFSKRSFAELIKSILKVCVIGYILYASIKNEYLLFPKMIDMSPLRAMIALADLTFSVAFKAGIVLLVLAVGDMLYQRWQYMQDLRMTKQEVKEEIKQTEGNPQIKAKIREKQRQMAMNRMMHKVPQADVVITNPTHYAVALQYSPGTMEAPIVIAKGQDRVAERIKEIARENEIAIVENKPLAQALYRNVEINDPIPMELYQAVAEVLAFVYRLKKRQVG